MAITNKEDLREIRKQTFAEMEQRLKEMQPKEEDSLFYYHSSEDRIVLSHAMFWVMSRSLKGKVAKEKFFLLLRKYQEEMLDAFLQMDDYFTDLLHYCNIMYEMLPMLLKATHDVRTEKDASKLAAIAIVAAGYAGDMPEDQCHELLDDIDYAYNRISCQKIEQLLPTLKRMVEEESLSIAHR